MQTSPTTKAFDAAVGRLGSAVQVAATTEARGSLGGQLASKRPPFSGYDLEPGGQQPGGDFSGLIFSLQIVI
jgi:hypothetical protein